MSGVRVGEHGSAEWMNTLDAGPVARRSRDTAPRSEPGPGAKRWDRSRRARQSSGIRARRQSCWVFGRGSAEWAMTGAIAGGDGEAVGAGGHASATATSVPCAKTEEKRVITRQNRPSLAVHICAKGANLCARSLESWESPGKIGDFRSFSADQGSAKPQRKQEGTGARSEKSEQAPTSVPAIYLCAKTMTPGRSTPETIEPPARTR